MIQESSEYKIISNYYGNRVANRSRVPLINHIDEGLIVLDSIGAVTEETKRAFCLHPLFQSDDALLENAHLVSIIDPYVLFLTMEYRNTANAYLSDKIDTNQRLTLSPISEVNQMLIADKVQNRKDFITYHKATHERAFALNAYFIKWLDALGISDSYYSMLCKRIDDARTN